MRYARNFSLPWRWQRTGPLQERYKQGTSPRPAPALARVSVFSPIAFQEFDAQKYREFIQTLSDDALIKEGKKLRWLSGDGKIVSTTRSAFDTQLKICREEYQRRHLR